VDVTSLGFRTDLMVLRLGGSEVVDAGDCIVVRTPANPTFWWGNFLLVPEPFGPGDGKRWVDRFRREFPDASHRAIGVDTVDGAAGLPAELEAAGVESDVSVVLTAPSLVEPPESPFEIRMLITPDDWQQAYSLRGAVYGEPESSEAAMFPARQIDAARTLTEGGHAVWIGAIFDGQLVASLGIVSDGRGLARFQSVETHPDFRRRGIARRLLYDAATYAANEFAATTTVIVADPDDHAIALYRSVGFADTERQVRLQAAR